MTAQSTHWLEYGEPVDGERVEAVHRITYQTGANGHREDDVRYGTLSYEGLNLGFGDNDDAEHVHDDGSLMLSALDGDKREAIMAEFEPADIKGLIERGCSPAEAVDWYFVEIVGLSQTEWAAVRDVKQPAVSDNVKGAREKV